MKYIKEELETMLRNHRKNEAKLTELELKQEEYEERLAYAGTVYLLAILFLQIFYFYI